MGTVVLNTGIMHSLSRGFLAKIQKESWEIITNDNIQIWLRENARKISRTTKTEKNVKTAFSTKKDNKKFEQKFSDWKS
jgi:hypothetical protein